MTLRWFKNSGRVNKGINAKFIKRVVILSINLRVRVVWVLKNSKDLMRLCWLNKFGLIHDNSLFYKVFEAKFFLNGSVFDAKASSGSYAWKSILRARKVIANGAVKRIGDGSNIQIYKDNWLLGGRRGRIISSPSFLSTSATVSSLIDDDSRWWNQQLIDLHFLPFEVQKIKSIPLFNFLRWLLACIGRWAIMAVIPSKQVINFFVKSLIEIQP